MNTLIKKMFTALLLIMTVSCLYAENIHSDIDLSITIASLDKAAESGSNSPEAGISVILNGTVLERRLIDAEKESFLGELILASGKWIDSESVVISKCLIQLSGPQFAETIPARRSRNVNPKEISLNSEMLVYGIFLGYAKTPDGVIAVIEAVGLRKL